MSNLLIRPPFELSNPLIPYTCDSRPIALNEIRVLHITPWFPHDDDPSRTVYIRRQIDALAPFVNQHILHLDIDNRQYEEKSDERITITEIKPLFNFWRWKEWAFYRELKRQLILLDAANQFTHVNF
ncbi:MAG: hypothetical protein ACKVOK_14855, partial [Flavobacteriales bacterium]